MEQNHYVSSMGGEPQEKHFDFFRIMRRRKGLLFFGALAGLSCGLLGGWFLGGLNYESSAKILVIKKHLETAPISGPNAAQPQQVEDYLSSHQIVIASPRIIQDAVRAGNLNQLQCFPDKAPDQVAKTIAKQLSVDRVFKIRGGSPPNNILNLYYQADNPEDARTILAAILSSYQKSLAETYRNVNAEALELIGRAKEVLHQEIKAQEAAYLKFRQTTPPMWKRKDGGTVQLERLYNIDAKRSTLRMRQAEIQATLTAVENGVKNGLGPVALVDMVSGLPTTHEIIATGLLSAKEPWQAGRSARATLEEELINLQLQQAKLLENYGAHHPQVLAAKQRIAQVRNLITPGNGNPPNGIVPAVGDLPLQHLADMKIQLLRQELKDNKRAEESLALLFEREQEEAKATGIDETQDDMHRKALDRSQLLYQSIIKRLQELDTVKDYGGYNTQVISEPEKGQWVWKKFALIAGIGTFLGLVLGFAGAWKFESGATTFRTPREVAGLLGVPGVSHLPLAGPAVSAHGVFLLQAEAFQAVRALIFTPALASHKVLQVTSPEPGDGKTTLAANLAVSLAQAGKKVLLVDAHFRGPRLHQLFGLANTVGLSSLLAGQAKAAEVTQTIESVPGLFLLASGPLPPQAAELLTSGRLKEALDTVRPHYDFVLLDSPSLLTVPDAAVVAGQVDGVVLTLRIAKNGRPRVQAAREILDRRGAKIVAAVVNGIKRFPNSGSPSLAHYPDDAEY